MTRKPSFLIRPLRPRPRRHSSGIGSEASEQRPVFWTNSTGRSSRSRGFRTGSQISNSVRGARCSGGFRTSSSSARRRLKSRSSLLRTVTAGRAIGAIGFENSGVWPPTCLIRQSQVHRARRIGLADGRWEPPGPRPAFRIRCSVHSWSDRDTLLERLLKESPRSYRTCCGPYNLAPACNQGSGQASCGERQHL